MSKEVPLPVRQSQRIGKLRHKLLALHRQGASVADLEAAQKKLLDAIAEQQNSLRPRQQPVAVKFVGCAHQLAAVSTIVKVRCVSCGGDRAVGYQAFECAVHGRCLPRYKPRGEAVQKWHDRKPESDLYHLCGEGFCQQYKVAT